ncbi:MAG: hypothetical protein IJ334_01600, partial [Clostridia bacterium]|nr:hypothetical protein [Clostridia bacterium]
MKRIFSLCMTILAVACVQNVVNAEDGFTEQSKTQLFSSQEEVLDAWGGFSEQEQEDYAGMYMTDNGELVIQFKADSSSYTYAVNKMTKQRNVLRNTEQTMSQSIIVEEATYTYDTLKDAYGIVVENAYDYDGVKSISFSNKDNCLYVGVLNNVDKEYLKVELLNILCREMSLDAFCSYKDFVN